MKDAAIHIYRPKGHYIGQVRLYGHQKWQTVTGNCQLEKTAMLGAIRAMTAEHKRARVLFCADWFEPTIMMECVR